MSLKTAPVARASMLIRRPVSEVFKAFVDPTITTQFWFTRASGPLEQGAIVQWHWDFYGASGEVFVRRVELNTKIEWDWPSPVEFTFREFEANSTFVSVLATDFSGDDDEQVAQALDSTEGFNLVLAACKVFLEQGINPRLIADKNPFAWVSSSVLN